MIKKKILIPDLIVENLGDTTVYIGAVDGKNSGIPIKPKQRVFIQGCSTVNEDIENEL